MQSTRKQIWRLVWPIALVGLIAFVVIEKPDLKSYPSHASDAIRSVIDSVSSIGKSDSEDAPPVATTATTQTPTTTAPQAPTTTTSPQPPGATGGAQYGQPVQPVPGRVVFIGDSIGDGLEKRGLRTAFPQGWSVFSNSVGSRTIHNKLVVKGRRHPNGYHQAYIYRNKISKAQAVVIQLGTNADNRQEQAMKDMVRRVYSHKQPAARVYWVNTYNPRPQAYTKGRNAIIQRLSRHPQYGFTVIDWHQMAASHTGWFKSDSMRLHPNLDGSKALIREIVRQVTLPR